MSTDEQQALVALRFVLTDDEMDYKTASNKICAAQTLLTHAHTKRPAPATANGTDRLFAVAVVALGVAACIASLALLVWAIGGVIA